MHPNNCPLQVHNCYLPLWLKVLSVAFSSFKFIFKINVCRNPVKVSFCQHCFLLYDTSFFSDFTLSDCVILFFFHLCSATGPSSSRYVSIEEMEGKKGFLFFFFILYGSCLGSDWSQFSNFKANSWHLPHCTRWHSFAAILTDTGQILDCSPLGEMPCLHCIEKNLVHEWVDSAIITVTSTEKCCW